MFFQPDLTLRTTLSRKRRNLRKKLRKHFLMSDIHLRKKHTGTGEVISGKTVQIFKTEIIFQNEDISFG